MTKTRTLSALLAAGALVLALGACSSDDGGGESAAADQTTTTAAADGVSLDSYCTAIQDAAGGGEPGFDQFFADHPDPTLEDWAGFLPDVVDQMDATITAIDAVEPAPEAAEAQADVVAAMTTVKDSFAASLADAEAGDQEAFDAEEATNQNENVPAMEASFTVVKDLCGIDDSGSGGGDGSGDGGSDSTDTTGG